MTVANRAGVFKPTSLILAENVVWTPYHWGWKGDKARYDDRSRMKIRGSDGQRISTSAYRVLYTLMRGPIPEGKVLAHQCGAAWCVNPFHVEPRTQKENLQESQIALASINAAKTHCVNGHEFNEQNTATSYRGSRRCRRCEADRAKAKWAAMGPGVAAARQRDYLARRKAEGL